jgi:hypothetical protein
MAPIVLTYGLIDMGAGGLPGGHSYLVKHVRLYAYMNNGAGRWKMLSHRDIEETSSITFNVLPSK